MDDIREEDMVEETPKPRTYSAIEDDFETTFDEWDD